jgi:hypothetical protein
MSELPGLPPLPAGHRAPPEGGLEAAIQQGRGRRRRGLTAAAVAASATAAAIVFVATLGPGTSPDTLQLTDPDATPSESVEPSGEATPSTTPTAQATTTSTSTVGPGSSAVLLGRAVGASGEGLGGLYVYVLPPYGSEAFRRFALESASVVTRTTQNGDFELACPDGPVLLASYPLVGLQPDPVRNLALTFVGGATEPRQAEVPECSGTRQTTRIARGAVVEGQVRGSADCPEIADGNNSRFVYAAPVAQIWPIRQRLVGSFNQTDGSYRLVALPPGEYHIYGTRRGEGEAGAFDRQTVTVSSGSTHTVNLTMPSEGRQECASPTPSATAEPTSTSAPVVTATPEPSAAP